MTFLVFLVVDVLSVGVWVGWGGAITFFPLRFHMTFLIVGCGPFIYLVTTLFDSTLLMFLHILWLRSWYYVMDVLIYISCYYNMDSTLLMLIHIFLLRYLTYVAAFLQKLLSLLTAKWPNAFEKKIICFLPWRRSSVKHCETWLKMIMH
jgi:hypothetical protein